MSKPTFKTTAQVRAMPVLAVLETPRRLECTRYVEGYAARYEPYVLYEDEDGPVYECFDRNAFRNADISDVIMQYDHAGRVLARVSNRSLIVEADDNGLFMAGNLDLSDAARAIYDDIGAGLVSRMSWRWRLGEYEYDRDSRTIIHHTVRKIYDVSAVSIPANDNTEISARSWADGVIDLARRSDRELDERRRRLRINTNDLLRRINYES